MGIEQIGGGTPWENINRYPHQEFQGLTSDNPTTYPTDCDKGSTLILLDPTTKKLTERLYFSGDDWFTEKITTNIERTLTERNILANATLAYANDALINTVKNVDIAKPVIARDRHVISVYNPSTVSDLTVRIFTKKTMTAGIRYVYVGEFPVPKAAEVKGVTVDAYSKIIEGLFVGGDARVVITNDTALGAATGFTGSITIDEF